MAYDESRHNVVLFGGVAGETLFNDTWTWNGMAWAQHQGLTASPTPRQGADMAYDGVSRQVILFGGLGSNGRLSDTWAWDGTAWQPLSPAHSPLKREAPSMTFDPALNALILYGGVDSTGATPRPLNETWSWQGGDWKPLAPTPNPSAGARARVAFLSGANVIERFGDCGGNDRNLYTFDGHGWATKQPSGSWPPAVCLPGLAGDSARHHLVLFGGNNPDAGQAASETWIYDGTEWKMATPAQTPPARYQASLVYDADHHVVVLFGGQGLGQGQTGPLNDTWTWDGGNWTQHQ